MAARGTLGAGSVPRAACSPAFLGRDPRHRLVREHAKQDPRPISPAEAVPDRLRKLEDPGETLNPIIRAEKIPSGLSCNRRMSGMKPKLPAPASTLIICPLDLRSLNTPEGQVKGYSINSLFIVAIPPPLNELS
jgi:hypothetical protein